MSSKINPTNIDSSYPIAGQDNDSQGFRDNFFSIQKNFTVAQTEISDLQNKGIFVSALGSTGVSGPYTNDLNHSILANVQLQARTDKVVSYGTWDSGIQGSLLLKFDDGNYHTFQTANNVTLDFSPTNSGLGSRIGEYAVITVDIDVTNISHVITVPGTVTFGFDQVAGAYYDPNSITKTITFFKTGVHTFQFATIDGGYTIAIFDMLRNKTVMEGDTIYKNGQIDKSYTIANVVTDDMLTIDTTYHKWICNTDPVDSHVANLWVSLPNLWVDGSTINDGREIQVTSLANISNCFVNYQGSPVYFQSNTYFATGNVTGITSTFTYNATDDIWMKF